MKEIDWWWIDYLENDLDPSTLPDIEYLLEHSDADREEFEKWNSLKQWVRESDPVNAVDGAWSAAELEAQKRRILEVLDQSETGRQTGQVHLRLV